MPRSEGITTNSLYILFSLNWIRGNAPIRGDYDGSESAGTEPAATSEEMPRSEGITTRYVFALSRLSLDISEEMPRSEGITTAMWGLWGLWVPFIRGNAPIRGDYDFSLRGIVPIYLVESEEMPRSEGITTPAPSDRQSVTPDPRKCPDQRGLRLMICKTLP